MHSLIVELSSFQLSILILSLIGFVYNYDIIINSIGNVKYFFFLGMVINVCYLVFLILMIFSKKLVVKLINFVYSFLKKLHFKRAHQFYEKAIKQSNDYHECSEYLKKHKIILVKILLTTLVQMFLYFLVPYFVYRAFGLNKESLLSFMFLQAVFFVAVSYIPFPGTVGASESGFMIMYKMFFPKELLSSAMIMTRAINFYLFVLFTGFLIISVVLYNMFKNKKKDIYKF